MHALLLFIKALFAPSISLPFYHVKSSEVVEQLVASVGLLLLLRGAVVAGWAALGGPRLLQVLLLAAGGGVVAGGAEGLVHDVLPPQDVGKELCGMQK